MSRVGLALRLAVQAALVLVCVPVALVGTWLGLRAAGRLSIPVHRTFLRLFGVRVTTLGQPPGRSVPTLVLANHVSWLDIPVIGSLLPLSFVAKSEVAGWPVVGWLARLQRSVFVDRSRKAATAEVNLQLGERLASGDAIVLFAEGTTGDGLRTLPFRSSLVGAVRAALAGTEGDAIRLQPLALVYARRGGLPVTRCDLPGIAWYGDMELGPHVAEFVRRGPLDVVAVWGEPILLDARGDRKRATATAEATVRAAIRTVRAGRPGTAYSLAGPAVVERPDPVPGEARPRPA